MSADPALLDLRDLTVDRKRRRGVPLRALDAVSLQVRPGETVGLVGESGAGKSTLAAAVLGLVPVTSGTVHFGGADITHARPGERRAFSSRLQAVFQDPYSSLNPARTVFQTLSEPLLAQNRPGRAELRARVEQALARVGLPPDAASRHPVAFSGGQRQRIAIARALMLEPSLVICDEPVSALDVSVQAQLLNLLTDLQAALGLSYLFISHDLGVIAHLSHRVVVLHRGAVMESGPAETVLAQPQHPYTRALLRAAEPARRSEQ